MANWRNIASGVFVRAKPLQRPTRFAPAGCKQNGTLPQVAPPLKLTSKPASNHDHPPDQNRNPPYPAGEKDTPQESRKRRANPLRIFTESRTVPADRQPAYT